MELPALEKLPKNEQTNNNIYEVNEKLRKYITQENIKKNQKTSCLQRVESNGKLQRSLSF